MTRIPFDAAEIRALADILTETGLTEIEISEGDSRIRIARAPAQVTQSLPAVQLTAAPAGTAPPEAAPAPRLDDASHPGAVTSPMVGVAYLSQDPASPPFVTVGQTVAAGQTLLLIEAMKTYNQIKAPKAGTVARVLVASGAPVEYGEVLMVLE